MRFCFLSLVGTTGVSMIRVNQRIFLQKRINYYDCLVTIEITTYRYGKIEFKLFNWLNKSINDQKLMKSLLSIVLVLFISQSIHAQELKVVSSSDLKDPLIDLNTQLKKSKLDLKVSSIYSKDLLGIEVKFVKYSDDFNCCILPKCKCEKLDCKIKEQRKQCCDSCFEPGGFSSDKKMRGVDLLPGMYEALFKTSNGIIKKPFKVEPGKKYVLKLNN